MTAFAPALLLLAAVAVVVLIAYSAQLALTLDRDPLVAAPFSGGLLPDEHAWSRFHPRWYAVSLVFLAFDVEMIFMYPWALVVAEVGTKAVVEMFGFLGLLLAGVLYAWREGALRWA